MRLLYIISTLMLFNGISVSAQLDLQNDWAIWNDVNAEDTLRLKAMKRISWDGYLFTYPDSAFYYAQMQYDSAMAWGQKKHAAIALNTQGVSFAIRGEQDLAIDYFYKNIAVYGELGDKLGCCYALNNLGNLFSQQGDYAKAVDHFAKSLELYEQMGDRKGSANPINGLGMMYKKQGEYDRALEYHELALKIQEENEDLKGMSVALSNIAIVYGLKKDYDAALEKYQHALKIVKKIQDLGTTANYYNQIGNLYFEKGENQTALTYFDSSLALVKDMDRTIVAANSLLNKARVYNRLGEYGEALKYGLAGSDLMQQKKSIEDNKYISDLLYQAYKGLHNYDLALEMLEINIKMKDSLAREENQKAIIRMEFKNDYTKRFIADSIAFAQQQEMDELTYNAKLEKEKLQRYGLYSGIGVLILIAGLVLRGYMRKKNDNALITKQKREVEHQKEIVEDKNREITDSITYAKRIQEAILPPQSLVKNHLPQSFLLYKPKDIVAGDFYWMEPIDDSVVFAVADCTGHGVPGALVSVVCNNAMNRAVREFGLVNPGEILDQTRVLVIEQFRRSDENVKDGMDIALCQLNKPAMDDSCQLSYAGANNPLWVITKRENLEIASVKHQIPETDLILHEIKANKQPIGLVDDPKPFSTHNITLMKGDRFYIFTDGYVDQFGGEHGKKFKINSLRKLILSIQDQSIAQQAIEIDQVFESWKANLEQIDDVCIMGVEI